MDRIIKVTGKGRIAVKPDTTRLILSLEGSKKEYDEALELSSQMTAALKSVLEPFGFGRQELKTLSFNVDAQYEGYKAKDGSWKQRFVGYRYSHRMKLEFPVDNARLGKLLYALAHSDAKPEIRIEHTVANPEPVKNQLLAYAVADSKAKAAILCEAAGVALGEVVTIDYSWDEVEFVSRPMDRMMFAEAVSAKNASIDLDIQADDIDVSDTVTVVWRIG
ncbi:MAG: SIMPL domain-containing protein [Coriobacteriales bacterium]|nr:SIMPL domain-containing protein [Coriobacteriales bacterium]